MVVSIASVIQKWKALIYVNGSGSYTPINNFDNDFQAKCNESLGRQIAIRRMRVCFRVYGSLLRTTREQFAKDMPFFTKLHKKPSKDVIYDVLPHDLDLFDD